MNKKNTLIIIFGLIFGTTFGQEIKIGQSAEEIKYLVENGTAYRPNTSWDVQYQNGKISDVILCYENEYLQDAGLMANFCKYFIMKNEKLEYILTQYENLSVTQLKKSYNKLTNYIKIGDNYYESDYKNYSTIYLHDNGLATIEWNKTDLNSLPTNIRIKIENDIKLEKKQEYQKQVTERKRRKLENEISKKTFDFEKAFPKEYEIFIGKQRNEFLQFFRDHIQGDYTPGHFFPKYHEIMKSKQKFVRSTNTYSIGYKTGDPYSINLISGNDNNLSIGLAVMTLPNLHKEGIRTNAKLNLDKVKIDYTIGFTSVKIKNSKVEFKKTLPIEEHKALLVSKLREFPNGKHFLIYEVSDILGILDVNVKIAESMGRFIKIEFED